MGGGAESSEHGKGRDAVPNKVDGDAGHLRTFPQIHSMCASASARLSVPMLTHIKPDTQNTLLMKTFTVVLRDRTGSVGDNVESPVR